MLSLFFNGVGYFIPDSKMLKNLYKQLDINKTDKQIWEEVTKILVKVQGSSTETILQTRFDKALSNTDKTKCLKNYSGKCVASVLPKTNSRQEKIVCLYCKKRCAKKLFKINNLDEFKDIVINRFDCDCVNCNFDW